MSSRRPPSAKDVAEMLGWVGSNAYEMADGWARFRDHGDIPAGRSSDTAMRSLLEFLVGRKSSRHPNDFQPIDAHPSWTVDQKEVAHLRERMAHIDAHTAHLSLARAKPFQGHPENWGETVARVLRLLRRYTDEIHNHPAHARLAVPVAQAEARLATTPAGS